MSPLLIFIVLFSSLSQFIAPSQSFTCTAGAACDAVAYIEYASNSTYRNMYSGGCPSYISTASNPGSATYQCDSESYYVTPILQDTPTEIGIGSCVLSSIGRTNNGVALFGPCDADGADAYLNEGVSFDPCGGHHNIDGEYHYHVNPVADGTCLSGYTDVATQHSPLLGFMIDGVPIYGPYGDNGLQPTLDSCGGCTDTTYSYYHYHTPYVRLSYPYLVSCLKGCIPASVQSSISKACVASATQYDYSSLASYKATVSVSFSASISQSIVAAVTPTSTVSGSAVVVASSTGTGSKPAASPSKTGSISGTGSKAAASSVVVASTSGSGTGSKAAVSVSTSRSSTGSPSESLTPASASNSNNAINTSSATQSKISTRSGKGTRTTSLGRIQCKQGCQQQYRVCKREDRDSRRCRIAKRICVGDC